MKMYCFEESVITTQRKYILKTDSDEPMYVPVPYFLIEKDGDYILYDTGYNHKAYKSLFKIFSLW